MSFTGKAAFVVAALGMVSASVLGAGTATAAGDEWGAMAADGNWDNLGRSINFPNRAEAEAAAIEQCGAGGCAIKVVWANGCMTLVENNEYIAWGVGANRAESEKAAYKNLTQGTPQAILLDVGSSQLAGQAAGAKVVVVSCTANVG